MTTGETITRYRNAKRYTQRFVAQRAGITPQYLNDVEHGRRNPPTIPVIERIADVLGIERTALIQMAVQEQVGKRYIVSIKSA